MSFIQNLFTSRDNKADGGTNVGQQGRLWYDPTTNGIYVSDGSTPGGLAVGGLGNGVPGGLTTQVQFNNNGQFGGSAGLTFNRSSNTLTGGGPATFAGTVTGGNILTTGEVSATGNITGNVLFGNGSQITDLPVVVSGNLAGNLTANGFFINGLTALTVAGDITGDNLITVGTVSATGNVEGGNIVTVGVITATGNILGGNILTTGEVSATGNVTGNYFIGDGSALTGITPDLQGNLTGNLQGNSYGANAFSFVSATGNITGGNIQTSGILSVSGNIIGSGPVMSLAGSVTATDVTAIGNLFVPLNGTAFYSNVQTIDQISSSKTTGGITIGGATQTGTIALGVSTASQSILVGNSATGSGNTKTISIGTSGAANSTTTITIGTNAGNATATYTANTKVAIANTSSTALSVAGTITSSSDITANGSVGGGNLTVLPGGGTTILSSATGTDQYSTGKTTGTVDIGGAAQTGTITVGRATVDQTVGIATGVVGSGNIKTIDVGTAGAAGSNTTITIGTDAGNATVTYTANTTVAMANTSSTALSVAGTITSGNISAANITSTGGGNAGTSAVTIVTDNAYGGANYAGFITMTNSSAGVTNPNKYIRINPTGNLEIINSSYANTIFALSDSGNIITAGTFSAGGNIVTAANLIITGSANISNYSYVPQYWFKGTLSSDQTLTASTDTTILYNTNADPLSWGGTAGSNGRVVPTQAGWYEVISRAQFSATTGNTSAQINHQIAVNGISQAITQYPNATIIGAGFGAICTAFVLLNGTTDYITTTCYSTVTGQACVGGNSTLLIIKWIST